MRRCGGAWGGGGGRGERGGGGGGRLPPPPPQTPPPQAKPNPPQPAPKKRKFSFELSDQIDDGAIPRPKRPKPAPTTTTAGPTKAVLAPKPTNPPKTATTTPPPPTKTDTPKGAEKKDDRPEDPIVGTVVHVPYPKGVEKGTVRGIHRRKYGAVWMEYPGGTTLYEVSRSLLFPTPEDAERHREEARAEGPKKTKPPTPTNETPNPPNANPTTEPTNPTYPPNATNPPSGPAKMWDPTTGSHKV